MWSATVLGCFQTLFLTGRLRSDDLWIVALSETCVRLYLIVDMCVALPPRKIVPQGAFTRIADSAAIEARHTLQGCAREELWPVEDVGGRETGHYQGYQLAGSSPWMQL